MIANMNFALSRFGNNKKGKTINMRNGDCDQVFSSPTKGSCFRRANIMCIPSKNQRCMSFYQGPAPDSSYTNYKNPMSDAEYKAYEDLYNTAKNYLVIKDGDIFSTGYGSDRSLGWRDAANAGKNFLEILKETYEGVDIIECSENSGGDVDDPGDAGFPVDGN